MTLLYRLIACINPKSKILPRDKIDAGYQKLIGKNLIEKLNNLNIELMLSDVKTLSNKKMNKQIIGVPVSKLIQFDNQWKSTKFLGNLNFVTSLCLSMEFNQPLIYPIKKNWIEILSTSGIKINKFVSLSLFRFLMLSQIIKSFYKSFIFLFKSFYCNKIFLLNDSTNSNFLHIPNLQKSHLNGELSYNLVGWLKNDAKTSSNLIITHSNPAIEGNNLKLQKITLEYINLEWRWTTGILKDFGNRLTLIFRCFLFFFKAKKRSLILLHLHSILIAHYASKFLPQKIMTCILFDQSQGSLMPLWTSKLTEQKCKKILFFYALAAEPNSYLCKNFRPSLFANSTWDEMWVIDKLQSDMLQSVMFKTSVKFKEKSVPGWIDSIGFIPKHDKSIALYDSEPQQFLYYLSPLMALGFFTENFYDQFFKNILERAKYYDFKILHKSKRSVGKNLEPFYKKIIMDISEKYPEHYINVKYDVSPKKLSSLCAASICQPISTTAIISKLANIPTVFYDPLNNISPTDPMLRKIPLLHTNDLDSWFDKLSRSLVLNEL